MQKKNKIVFSWLLNKDLTLSDDMYVRKLVVKRSRIFIKL